MKRKPLWRISVATTLEAEDAVSEILVELLGAGVSSFFDVERRTTLVSLYLEQTAAPAPKIRRAIRLALAHLKTCGLNAAPRTIKIERVRHEDWAESWKRHFKPIEIGRTLLIKPSWNHRRPKLNQHVVILDPGLSFGTGQHPTTSFCLGEVVRNVPIGAPRSFLDIGTGSGILAIAAAKLNFDPVYAFDFDPESVRVARENFKTNQVQKKIHLSQDDVTKLSLRPARKFDLVCANLISTLLLAEKKRIINQLKRGGTLVLAGILKTEFVSVQTAFESLGLVLTQTEALNEWQSGAFAFKEKD